MILEKSSKAKAFDTLIAIDIETGSKGELLDVGSYDGANFKAFRSWAKWLDYLIKLTGRSFGNYRVIAHNGLNFDYVTLLLHLAKEHKKYEIDIDNDLIILSAETALVGFILKLGKARISFVDTMRYFPGLSLEKVSNSLLGEQIGKDKIPDDFISRMQDYKRLYKEKYYRYLEKDCRLLYDSYIKFRSQINDLYEIGELGWSSGSTSMNAFRVYLRRYDDKIFGLPTEHWPQARAAYRGGFVSYIGDGESSQRDYYPAVFSYDFNSMYPSIMRAVPCPLSPLIERKKINLNKGIPYGIFRVSFKQERGRIPLLYDHRDRSTDSPQWESGDSWLTTYDLLFLSSYGDFKIKEALIYESQDYLFADYIDSLWQERLIAKQNKDEARSLALKILLNSLYGKMGANPIGEKIAISSSLDYYRDFRAQEDISLASDLSFFRKYGYCLISTPEIRNGFSNQVIASLVTSGARLKLGMMLNGYRSIYCDTDSIFTQDKIDSRFLGSELGQLDSDLLPRDFICVGKKQYLYGEDKKASKGVPKNKVGKDEYIAMAKGEAIRIDYRSPSPLKTAINKQIENPNEFLARFRTIKKSNSMRDNNLLRLNKDFLSAEEIENFYFDCGFC